MPLPAEQIVIDGILTSFVVAKPNTALKAAPVVFLHGWASSKEVWGNALSALRIKGILSYALDLPGFGKTELPPTVWDVSDYANFIAKFLQKLNIPPAVIVGHSFGGRIGLVLAATHPQLLAKLILVDSAGVRTSREFKKFLASVSKLVRPFFRLRWLNPVRKKIYRLIGAEDYVATPELNKTFVNVISEDLTKFLPLISAPTLIIWGQNDFVTPVSYAKQFAAQIKNSRLVILEHAGHYSFLDKPENFLQELKDFV